MENVIFVNRYENDDILFSLNRKEVLRYAGYLGALDKADDNLNDIVDEVINECKKTLTYKVCYRRMEYDLASADKETEFLYKSKDLDRCLNGSKEVIIFAATIGIGIDRLIAKYQRLSPVKALFMQAYGAERVEKLCDVFCKEIKEKVAGEGLYVTPRFSPGYGDMLLEAQKDVFRLLDCSRQIGVSLNQSLLMTPSKSVTAIFGLRDYECMDIGHKCSKCRKTDCLYSNIK
ncbi:MAG: Vitamin B12 dependent methionine synthase activation subunit [Lachnospiraceae bacterium]|nr:Vitamin B12 dependent methionine synthase activation subunit [Lachnospiraceae bacterium]